MTNSVCCGKILISPSLAMLNQVTLSPTESVSSLVDGRAVPFVLQRDVETGSHRQGSMGQGGMRKEVMQTLRKEEDHV